ncbi:hypothetical protein ACFYOK_35960 [Microbispora bryophytorum]
MIDIEAHVRAVVQDLGAPTPDQIARLRLILTGWQSTEETTDAAA